MNSPFGQSAFGKTTTSGFTTPAFGSTGSSLFGGNPSTSGGLFGGSMTTPVFGQTQTTQPSTFGFGTNTTSSGLFGTQQNANTSLFGGGTTSAFGANKPTFGGFGSTSTSLFGQTQQPQATSSLFGQPATASTSGGLFGSSGGFGASTSTQAVGTPIKFIPATGTDTMVKSGVTQTINTRHHCITCMKEYESKSLEELRLEDYMLNRKGPQQQPQQSSLFGGTGQSSLFGSPASTSTGGSSLFQDKPLFGGGTSIGFGTSTGVFGSTNQQSSSLFGKPTGFGTPTPATTQSGFGFNTTTTANPFGTTTQAKPFGTVTPQTNLFGGTGTQPSTFGTQSTGFGGFGAPQNQSIGLFNQNKSPFGMTTTSTGFSFGQNTPTNQTSSLFTKPAGTTGFGTFGTNTSTGTGFGTGNMFASNQNSLFNQSTFGKTTTSGFTFGQTQPTSTGLGTGLNLGGQSLFGSTSKPGGLFGSSTGMFSGSGSTFGTGTNFGGLGSGLGTNLNLGGSTLMGGTAGITTPSQQLNLSSVHEQLLSLTSSMPFGDTPLFRNLLPVTGKTDELLKANAPKTNTGNNQLKVTTHGSSRVRPKPLTSVQPSRKALFAGLEDDNTAETVPEMHLTSGRRLLIKPFSGNNVGSPNGIISSISESNKENDISGYLGATSTPHKESERTAYHKARSQSFVDASTDTTVDTRAANLSTSILENCRDEDDGQPEKNDDIPSHPTGIKLTRAGYYTIPSLDELVNFMTEDGRCIVDNFTVGREGYGNIYFPESFDVAGLDLDEIVHFRHKEVVVYPDDADKPPVGEGLNRKAQVTLDCVWPIDKTTHFPIKDPERLSEMNFEEKLRRTCAKSHTRFLEFRPQTGSWVFRVDHFSKYGLSDSDEEDDIPVDLAKHMKPGVPAQNGIPVKPVKPGEALKPGVLQPVEQVADKQVPQINGDLPRPHPSLIPVLLEDDQVMEEQLDGRPLTPDDSIILRDDFEHIPRSPVEQIAKKLGYSSHNVQLMKATFFTGEEMHYDEDYGKLDQFDDDHMMRLEDQVSDADLDEDIAVHKLTARSFGLLHARFSREPSPLQSRALVTSQGRGGMLVTSAVLPEPVPMLAPIEQPKTVVLRQPHHVIHWEKMTAHKIKAGCIADLDLFRGCGFRVRWGPRSTLLTLTTQQAASTQPLAAPLSDLASYIHGRPVEDTSPCIVQRLKIAGGEDSYEIPFCETVEGHLNIELQHSENISDDECPYWIPQTGVDSLHAHYEQAKSLISDNSSEREQLLTYSHQVWELCVALWGNLATLDDNTDTTSHLSVMMRKNAVSEWLQYVVLPQVKRETSKILGQMGDPSDNEFYVPAVLSYLSAKNLMEACEKAQYYGDHYAVMLLAQVGGNSAVRHWLQNQLKSWQEVEADAFINAERLKLMMLAAGIPLYSSTHGTINVCEDLDWKRAFGLHLWYLCSPVASITDALLKYEAAFDGTDPQNLYAKCPYPPYVTKDVIYDDNKQLPYDLCFHLLKLYSCRTYSLDRLLDPATHTADKLDYRLSWFILQMLTALGYSHVSNHAAAHLHSFFAMQLESHGLWHWAIFVLLHLKDPVGRQKAVLDLLERHIELSENEAYLDREEFLTEKLQIPSQWIFAAKATLAVILKEYGKAAWYYIKSEQFNESHEIIMAHIAPNAIINENYAYLKPFLESLVQADPENTITEWTSGGQILWDYIQIIDDVKKLTSSAEHFSAYQLEKLHPQLSSLCTRINLLSCPTARHRLCQTEIAVRITHFIRVVGQLHNRGEGLPSHLLTRLLTQLPLPEDRVRDELNLVVDSVVRDLTSL